MAEAGNLTNPYRTVLAPRRVGNVFRQLLSSFNFAAPNVATPSGPIAEPNAVPEPKNNA